MTNSSSLIDSSIQKIEKLLADSFKALVSSRNIVTIETQENGDCCPCQRDEYMKPCAAVKGVITYSCESVNEAMDACVRVFHAHLGNSRDEASSTAVWPIVRAMFSCLDTSTFDSKSLEFSDSIVNLLKEDRLCYSVSLKQIEEEQARCWNAQQVQHRIDLVAGRIIGAIREVLYPDDYADYDAIIRDREILEHAVQMLESLSFRQIDGDWEWQLTELLTSIISQIERKDRSARKKLKLTSKESSSHSAESANVPEQPIGFVSASKFSFPKGSAVPAPKSTPTSSTTTNKKRKSSTN